MSVVDTEFPAQRPGRAVRLLSGLTVLAGCALAVGCRSAQHYYSIANQQYSQGKYREADLNYRKAIQKDPNFGAAVYRLGLTEIEEQQTLEAYQTLNRAVVLLPNDAAPRVRLADLILSSYLSAQSRPRAMYDRILELAGEIQRLEPTSPDAIRIRGVLAASDKRPAEAVELLRRANAARPGDPEVVLPLVQALVQNGQTEEAEKIALELIGKHKEFGQIYNALYLLYLGTNRPQQAEDILLAKVQNNPRQLQPVLELANHYRNSKKPELADTLLQRALEDAKTFPDAPRDVGNFYLERGFANKALACFQIGLKRSTGDQRILFQKRMVSSYLMAGQRQPALSLLEELIRQNPADDDSKYMRASLQIESGKLDELNVALAQMEDLVKRTPNNPDYRYTLGRIHYLRDKLDDAKREFAERLRLDPSAKSRPAKYFLAAIDIRKQLYPAAIIECNELLASDPGDVRAQLLKADALTQMKDFQQARQLLNALLRAQPQLSEAQLELGYLEIAEKHFKEADRIFRSLYQPGQPDIRPLSGLVDVAVARNQVDAAVQLLAEELYRNPGETEVRSALANLYFQSGRLDQALVEYRALTSLNPKLPDFLMRTGQVLQAKGDLPGALAAYRKAGELAPGSYVAQAVIGSTLQVLGRKEEATAAYRAALRINPSDPFVLNNLAFLLAEAGNNDEALELAHKALALLPSRPDIQDTLGWIYLKRHETESALQIFQTLARKNPENAAFNYHLGMAWAEKGDYKDARTALETALQVKPSQAEEAEIKSLLARINSTSAAQPHN